MTGTNAINYYAPQIFANLGLDSTKSSLFATGIYGLLKMAGCAAFLILVADSLGRRKSLLWTSIAQALCMFYIGIYVRIAPPKAGNVPPAGYAAIVMIYLFAIFCKDNNPYHCLLALTLKQFNSVGDQSAGSTCPKSRLQDCVQ